jgi:membrane-associated protease RseP (regulator of RpoE activity)
VLRPDMVIGFESFPRRSQPVLDRWVAGELTERQLLEQTEWNRVWNFPAQLYLPLFHFARLNRIPMLALNVERTLTEAVRKTGWDAVPIERKEGVSRPSAAADAYRESLYDVYAQHAHGPDGKAAPVSRNDAAFRHFVEAQLTWDRAMAQALAAPLLRADSARRPYVVGIMGSGHIRYGHGVPHQLRDLGLRNIGTLLPFSATRDCNELQRGIADAVYALPGMPRDDAPRPRLGVRLEEKAGEVRLAGVTPDSLAAQTGLQRGDRIVSIAGATVTRSDTVIEAVRSQPPGTWLPMEVQRGQQTLQLIVKFPRQ